jgi:hypothetical protein
MARLQASLPANQVQEVGFVSDDPMSRLQAAKITLSELEARKSDGAWFPVEGSLPEVVDVLTLANGGGAATIPTDHLPEGQFNALQLRIAQLELTPRDGVRTTIAPPGSGWVVQIPVDFGVVPGRETIVDLNLRLDLSLQNVNGQFEFDPEVELSSVEHN